MSRKRRVGVLVDAPVDRVELTPAPGPGFDCRVHVAVEARFDLRRQMPRGIDGRCSRQTLFASASFWYSTVWSERRIPDALVLLGKGRCAVCRALFGERPESGSSSVTSLNDSTMPIGSPFELKNGRAVS